MDEHEGGTFAKRTPNGNAQRSHDDGTFAKRTPNGNAQRSHDEVPRFLPMIGIVALSVAATILIFFGVGYLFGRLFL